MSGDDLNGDEQRDSSGQDSVATNRTRPREHGTPASPRSAMSVTTVSLQSHPPMDAVSRHGFARPKAARSPPRGVQDERGSQLERAEFTIEASTPLCIRTPSRETPLRVDPSLSAITEGQHGTASARSAPWQGRKKKFMVQSPWRRLDIKERVLPPFTTASPCDTPRPAPPLSLSRALSLLEPQQRSSCS